MSTVHIATLASDAQELTSIEHAILLSLLAKQHCILETEKEALNDLDKEVELVSRSSTTSNS
jgi:hypothetical protein